MPLNSTIWKFPLPKTGQNWIDIPSGWRALTAQMQGDTLTLWASVYPNLPNIHTSVLVLGTGWEHDLDGWDYVATAQDRGGFVWHVFVPSKDSL